MSLFPRTHFLSQAEQPHQTQSSYHPLFRFFDEFDQYSRAPERAARQSQSNTPTNNHGQAHASPFGSLFRSTPTFTPKFDVKEVKDGYELHGELPGIDQKDIEIEFTDSNTLTIKGRTERSYQSSTPPSSNNNNKGAIEDTKDKDDTQSTTSENRPSTSNSDHKAKVEDEDAALSSEVQNTIAKFRSEKQVTKHNDNKSAEKKKVEEEKYWISERSVGEFERSFSFPVRVDRDAVKASMKNGVLSVVVPKARKLETRRITIEDASN